MKKCDLKLTSICFSASTNAFILDGRIAPELNIEPLNAIYDTKGIHSYLYTIEYLIPFIRQRSAMIIGNDRHNISIFYNPFEDILILLQSIDQLLMRAILLTSFAYFSNQSASIIFSESRNL